MNDVGPPDSGPAAPAALALPPPTVDPVDVWRGEMDQDANRVSPGTRPPPIPPRPTSAASVASSASSLRRRKEYVLQFEQETAERQRRFKQEQELARVKMEEALHLADLESEAGSVRPTPRGSAAEEQADVAQRRLAAVEKEAALLKAEADSLRRSLARRVLSPAAIATAPPSRSSTPEATDLFGHAKLKVDKPKAWTGTFDHLAREGFIKSTTNYFASVRVSPATPVDDTVLGVVRTLFSAEAPRSGGVSPQRWFDSQVERRKFGSLVDIFAAMRAHWVDRDASDRARRALRTAEQGSMKAQEFGAVIDSLADECFDRIYDDDVRRDFFIDGLRKEVREFYRVQLAAWKDLHGDVEPSFHKAVEIAARSDLFSGRAAEPYAAKSISSHSTKPTSGTKGPLLQKPSVPSPSPSTASASPSPASHWHDAAAKWQAAHPMPQKAEWHRSNAPELAKDVRCWNCGKVARHYSIACPNARVDLRKVIVAALTSLGGKASLAGVDHPDSRTTDFDVRSESDSSEIEVTGKE